MKLDSQDLPFASFTYALSPLTDKLTPVDWKLLVTEDVECQHIRYHELRDGENFLELITDLQKAHTLAVVLINTSENYSLCASFLIGIQESHISVPVLLLTRSDGMKLLNKVEKCNENVFARISVESGVDAPKSIGPPQKTGNESTNINSDHTASKKPGQCCVGGWKVKCDY